LWWYYNIEIQRDKQQLPTIPPTTTYEQLLWLNFNSKNSRPNLYDKVEKVCLGTGQATSRLVLIRGYCKKSLKIPKRLSESMNQRTGNTIKNEKKTWRQTMVDKTLCRTLKMHVVFHVQGEWQSPYTYNYMERNSLACFNSKK